MINKQDCLTLLSNLETKDKNNYISEALRKGPTVDVLEYINKNRPLDLVNFYEKIRKSYNKGSSKLYINIMKEENALTTLSAMLTQILLYSENVDDKAMFLRASRAKDITLVLDNYLKTYDKTNAQRLLSVIKADIKIFETANGRDVI